MTTVFQPPPTWALPVIVDKTSGQGLFNPIWLKWFIDLSKNLSPAGAGSGSVTSVGITLPTQFTVAGSPVVDAGTLAVSWATEVANIVLAGPATGADAAPTFRSLVSADIPSLSGSYVPYTGATTDVDLNNKHLVNISHLGVGTTVAPNIIGRFVGDNGSLSRVAMRGYSSDANGSALRVAKFRGTYAAPQVPQSGDSLGRFEFAGYATTSADGLAGAYWEAVTTEMWSAIAHGTKVNLYVTPNATTTPVVAMTINQDKSITFPGPVVVSSNAPVTKTADFTLAATECWIINNKTAATCTVTLPAASLWTGRAVTFKNMQAFTLVSASSNVVPIDSTTAGTTILLNVVGNWATIVSDGTNWVIMQQAPNNILLLE